MRLKYQSAAFSHAGNVRALNEDACCLHPAAGVWCVADGMGGYDAGEVASGLVVDAVSAAIPAVQHGVSLEARVAAIHAAIQAVNRALTCERTQGPESGMMGCTVVALVAHEAECACIWAGDSRLYLLRAGGLYQLTRDHSVVQELLDTGIIDPAEAESHPERHVITRAVGVDSDLELDYLAFDLQAGDSLLLCSDGLYTELGPDRILALLTMPVDPGLKASRLVEAVLEGPARDNITVSIIDIEADVGSATGTGSAPL